MERPVTTNGFSLYEQGIIKDLLRFLKGKTSCHWIYDGEGCNGNIVFSRNPVAVSNESLLVLMGDTNQQPDQTGMKIPPLAI